MNQNESDHDWTDQDQCLRDLWEPVRNVSVPSSLEAACLAAAQRGLTDDSVVSSDRTEVTQGRLLSLSLAVAASLMLGTGFGWVLRGQRDVTVATSSKMPNHEQLGSIGFDRVPQGVPKDSARRAQAGAAGSAMSSRSSGATSMIEFQEDDFGTTFYTEELYLCGIGRIASTSKFRIAGESP